MKSELGPPAPVVTGRRKAALAGDERIRFVAIGAWNTLAGYLIFVVIHLLAGDGLGPALTLLVSYCFALPQSFVTQRLLVFRTRGPWTRQFCRFTAANSIIFFANLMLLPLAVSATKVDAAIVQAALVAFFTVASYLAHKHFSFASLK